MDGLGQQQSLKAPISCVGIGVHSGARVGVTLTPAPAGHGVVFRRRDLGRDILARFNNVADTRLATTLAEGEARVATVEHLMASLCALGIDNVLVEVDGPELPILDGSAAPWLFLLDCAGIVSQATPRRTIEVTRRINITDGPAWAELAPAGKHDGLELTVSIDFAAEAIGRQTATLRLTADSFRQRIARARTFALAEDVASLRAAGLALGGSLDNAVVVRGGKVLNPGGLRMSDEFVSHKLLDSIGDLALAGAPLHARFRAHRPSHTLHNRLLRALFADPSAWREIAGAPAEASRAAA